MTKKDKVLSFLAGVCEPDHDFPTEIPWIEEQLQNLIDDKFLERGQYVKVPYKIAQGDQSCNSCNCYRIYGKTHQNNWISVGQPPWFKEGFDKDKDFYVPAELLYTFEEESSGEGSNRQPGGEHCNRPVLVFLPRTDQFRVMNTFEFLYRDVYSNPVYALPNIPIFTREEVKI